MAEQIAWIELCGVPLGGASQADGGLVWEDLTGWWGLPDGRGNRDPIPGWHGSFKRPRLLRESRVLALKGFIMGAGRPEFLQARQRLTAALAEGVGVMRVATDEGVWEREVEVDTLEIEPDHGDIVADFTVDLVAPDPRRYGPLQMVGPVGLPERSGGLRLRQRLPWNLGASTGGRVLAVMNAGEIDLYPVLRITGGGMSRVSVRDITSGDRIELAYPVLPGVEVRIDCAARRVWVGEQDVTMHLESRQWPTIPAGQTHEFRFDTTGGTEPQLWADYRIGAW